MVNNIKLSTNGETSLMKNKIYDCVTFYNENLHLDLRFNILNDYVNKFVICESRFDHKGKEKKLNFKIQEFSKFKHKIIYLVLDKQKKGKARGKQFGKVEIPQEAFIGVLKIKKE